MSIEIREVATKSDFDRFVKFPYNLYRNNPYFVPTLLFDARNTLDRNKNPAFEFCDAKYWLALRDGEVVGRVAGIIHHKFIEIWKKKHARFGWIDFIDDEEVSAGLFATVEQWAAEQGMTAVHGPLGFTDLDEEGMLVEGFEEVGTLPMIYNHPYYPKHIEKLGYHKDVDWLELRIQVPDVLPEKVQRIASLVLKRSGVHPAEFRNKKDVLRYAPGVFDVLNQAYADLYGVTPLDEKQIAIYIKQYLGFLHKDFLKVLVNERDEVVSFCITAPSLSVGMRKAWGHLFPFGFMHILWAMSHPKTIDLYLVAVRPDYQGRGLHSVLMSEIHKSCMKHKTTVAETTAQLESNNLVLSFWKDFDFVQHKRRRIYIKELAGEKQG